MEIGLVSNIIDYIENNLEKGITINNIILQFGYSRGYVENIFKENTSMTLGYYIRSRRLTRAALLLILTKHSIRNIALHLNYSTHQSFSREFKRYTKYTPNQYKRSNTWDTSIWQSPLNFKHKVIPCIQFIQLQQEQLWGYNYFYEDKLFYDFSIEKYLQQKIDLIIKESMMKKKDIYISTNYQPSHHDNDLTKMNVFIGNKEKSPPPKRNTISPEDIMPHLNFRVIDMSIIYL
ncbi:helix-turn-helix domain-containing protein [Providencia alcalifaciens]|uniref:helix-turn-helix domain-containing protein n=1 Tax=Providencia alcalifaciens TaxID=126385 RepID=UPI0004507BFF|nr:helix-turn-helix domain-containing protein [Providencia alcalifaciens]EUD05549.1 DNA-binding helix-turn-helix protein [Providencia alcalifaciens R90-1475]